MQRSIIIDTDPGIDDAVAVLLALAAAELTVLGVVAVAGNVGLAATVRNAAAILDLAGRGDTPLYAGCPRPIGPGRFDAADVHGADGLGSLVLTPPSRVVSPQHGVVWLIDSLRAAAPASVTLCALGPLTNIATALVMAPDIASAVGELVVMGGGTRGNTTPAAEFNIYCDPEAAAIIFDSGLPITLVPLDITSLTRSTPERIEAIAASSTHCAKAVATLLSPPGGWQQPAGSPIPVHDACVIAWLLEPGLFHATEANVMVETASELTAGMTVIDTRGRSGRPVNARVLDAIDVDGLYRLLAERLALLP